MGSSLWTYSYLHEAPARVQMVGFTFVRSSHSLRCHLRRVQHGCPVSESLTRCFPRVHGCKTPRVQLRRVGVCGKIPEIGNRYAEVIGRRCAQRKRRGSPRLLKFAIVARVRCVVTATICCAHAIYYILSRIAVFIHATQHEPRVLKHFRFDSSRVLQCVRGKCGAVTTSPRLLARMIQCKQDVEAIGA